MAACTNLEANDEGEYEDPISLDIIPPERLVHLPFGELQYCYDALELLRYIESERQERRPPTLPDNRNLLTLAGVEEVRRVARLSFLPLYFVPGHNVIFDTEEEALDYVDGNPNTSYYTIADVKDDPLLLDLLYPDGYEKISLQPIPGPYIDEAAIVQRAAQQRLLAERQRAQWDEPVRMDEFQPLGRARFEEPLQGIWRGGEDPYQAALREAREENLQGQFNDAMGAAFAEQDARPVPRIRDLLRRQVEQDPLARARQPRASEIEVGDELAREVRPGEWRCGLKDAIYNGRESLVIEGMRNPGRHYPGFESYCSVETLEELRQQGKNVNDPQEWGLGTIVEVEGENVAIDRHAGRLRCSNIGGQDLVENCRADLVEEIAARQPRRYLGLIDEVQEIEYRFDRPSQHFHCRNLDNPVGEYDCDQELRDYLDLDPVAQEPDVIYRRLDIQQPFQCATKEEWHQARGSGQPIPWHPCDEAQFSYLLEQGGDDFMRNLEVGYYVDADGDDREDDVADGRYDVDEDVYSEDDD